MSLKSWLAGLFGPIAKIDAPTIGSAIAISRLENDKLYWESEGNRTVDGHNVLLVFYAPKAGPSSAQIDFLQKLQSKLTEIADRCGRLMQEELQRREVSVSPIQLRPSLVTLPDFENADGSWELMFSDENEDTLVTVKLQGDSPISVVD